MAVSHKILFFMGIVAVVSGDLFPSYIKKCKKDIHLNECILTNGQLAIQHLLDGDETLGIPSFKPYKHAVPVRYGAKPNLQFDVENMEFHGMPDVKIVKANWDVDNRKAYFKISYDNCTTNFDYKIAGPFVGHTLNGEGRGSIVSKDAWFSFEVSYGTETVNGIDYPKIENIDVDYKVGACIFDLKNLSDADHCPESELNKLLTTHWEEFNSVTKQDSKEVTGYIFKIILSAVFKTVPIDELFE